MDRHPVVQEVNKIFVEGFNRYRPPRSIGLRLVADCMRKTILDLNMSEEDWTPPDPSGMDNMSYGSAYEIWMLERLKNAGYLKHGGVLWRDMQVNVKRWAGNGYMDGLGVVDGEDIGIEIKTKGARGFDEIIKTRKPDKLHIYQLMIYMYYLNLKKGWLIYIDREKHFEAANGEYIPRWEIIEIELDEKVGEKLDRRLQRLTKHREEKTIPDKEPKDPSDSRCTWCSHRKYCWGESADNRKSRANPIAKRIATASKARRRALFKASTD